MKLDNNFYYKNNRLQQLRGFYYTLQLGSVSQAAIRMGLQQSAVSMQIKSLERDLETKLFYRKGYKFLPTEDGNILYELVLPHVEGIDSLQDRFVEKLKEKNMQKITIAANHISILYLLPEPVASCKDNFSPLDIKIFTRNREEAFEMIRRDEIEAYVGAIDQISHEFEFIPVVEHEIILMAKKDHDLMVDKEKFKLSDLANYPLVRSQKDFVTVPMFEEIVTIYNSPIHVHIENSDWVTHKKYIEASNSYSIFSMLFFDPKKDTDVDIISLKKYVPNIKYGVVIKKGKYLSPPLKHLIKSLKQTATPSPCT